MKINIQVIFYSMCGHIHTMTEVYRRLWLNRPKQ